MNTTDMETETTMSESRNDERVSVKGLLGMAHQFINEGKPSQALQAVVMAMRSDGGEEAVFRTLHQAREVYINKLKVNAATDELASLFAECVIAEAKPTKVECSQVINVEGSMPFDNMGGRSVVPLTLDTEETSILTKTGRKQIMLDAFSDGSSFICLQCGGLVSSQRKDEHLAYWCCQI